MPKTTRIAEAQDGLHELLRNRPNLTDVQIDLGWPRGGPSAEHIWISGSVEDWSQEWEVTGDLETADREEAFTLIVNLIVSQRDEYKVVRDRAIDLIKEIELSLRDDDTLKGAGFSSEFRGRRFDEGWSDETRQAAAMIAIRFTAYLGG